MCNRKTISILFFIIFISFELLGNPYADENFLEKGIAEFKAENFEEAHELLMKAREQQPQSSAAVFYLGLTYKQMGNYKEATKYLKEAVDLIPSINDAYTELIELFYTLNELKKAKDWIAKAEKEGVKPAHVSFLKGLILLKEGKNKAALNALEKAKQIDSSLTQVCDFQIAMIYMKEKKFTKAKESLKAMISIDPTSEIASFAREYEKAYSKTMEMYKPWRFTVGAAYQYDDNVVLKPSTAIPGVVITGEKDSSVITTFRIDYSPLLSSPWLFNGQLNFYANTYFDTKTHNIIVPTISLMPGYSFQKAAITLPVSYSHIWLHEREYESVTTVKPTLNIELFPNHIGQFSTGYGRREMLQSPLSKDEDRDGNIYLLSTGYVHPFSEGRGVFNLRYEFSQDVTEGKNWENIGNKFNLGLLIPVPVMNKLSLTMSGDIFLQDYTHTHTAFGVKRKDKTYSGSAGVVWEVLKGLNLNLQYSHTRADSNITVYDYKRNVYMAGIEYTF